MTISDVLGAAHDIEVQVMDLSGGNGADPIEVVRGFSSLAHANSFARRRVRDSLEFCRAPGMSTSEVTAAWFAFGEDAVVTTMEGAAPDGAWTSASELASFAEAPANDAEDRNWRILDPRRLAVADDDDGEEEEA